MLIPDPPRAGPPPPGEPPSLSTRRHEKSWAVRRRRVLAGLAARQHGIVSRRQLEALGFTVRQIDGLVHGEWLHPVHAGVYHVGHPAPSRLASHLAAAVGIGQVTGISHRPGMMLRGIVTDDGGPIHLTSATTSGGRRDGVIVHESRRLTAAELTRVQGVPALGLERTLVDVAGSCSPAEFARVFNALDGRCLVDPLLLARQLRRGRTGSAAVRARLEAYTEQLPTESELEALFVERIVEAGALPLPVPQSSPFPRRALRVDFAWPHAMVIVEIDGRAWHAIQAAWGEDHERDLALRLRGWRSLRYTYRQLTQTPELVLLDLRSALRHPA